MNKKPEGKKLQLKREIVRSLTTTEMEQINGGTAIPPGYTHFRSRCACGGPVMQ